MCANHPVGDVPAAMALDRARRALPDRKGVEQQRDHHRRLTGDAAMAVRAIVGVELAQIHLLNRLEQKPRQMVLRQPLAQRRRQQERLLTITPDEVLGHSAIVIADPDGAGVCATASTIGRRPPARSASGSLLHRRRSSSATSAVEFHATEHQKAVWPRAPRAAPRAETPSATRSLRPANATRRRDSQTDTEHHPLPRHRPRSGATPTARSAPRAARAVLGLDIRARATGRAGRQLSSQPARGTPSGSARRPDRLAFYMGYCADRWEDPVIACVRPSGEP